jgi:hypothetical protein
MGRKSTWKKQLDISKHEAVTAIKMFNDPTNSRPFENFIVHMHLAYLYLLQADHQKRGLELRVPESSSKSKFIRVDGEFMLKGLSELAKELQGKEAAIGKNILFFVSLRNKIEHRAPLSSETSQAFPQLIAGQIQAHLVNYEFLLTRVGGHDMSLANQLRFPIFIGGLVEDAKLHLASLTKELPADLRKFIVDFTRSVPLEVQSDPRFSLPLNVSFSSRNRGGHFSLNVIDQDVFESMNESPPEAMIVRSIKQVQVDGAGIYKPAAAVKKIAEGIPFGFNVYLFTQAWKRKKVRPASNAKRPELTETEYCTWNQTFSSYTYTQAFVDLVISECQTEAGFFKMTGKNPEIL